jgi:hypothetical protein
MLERDGEFLYESFLPLTTCTYVVYVSFKVAKSEFMNNLKKFSACPENKGAR